MDEDRNEDLGAQEEKIPEEIPVDLNTLFSEERRDLNRLFPDSRLRRFLRGVRRNRRDVERFLERLEVNGEAAEKSGGPYEVS